MPSIEADDHLFLKISQNHHSQPQSHHRLPPRRRTMKPLDHEEQEILEAFEAGTLRSVATAAERSRLEASARSTATKDQRINIRLTSEGSRRLACPCPAGGHSLPDPDQQCPSQVRVRQASRSPLSVWSFVVLGGPPGSSPCWDSFWLGRAVAAANLASGVAVPPQSPSSARPKGRPPLSRAVCA